MIIQVSSGGGLDKDGNPVPLVSLWSEPIECRFKRSLKAMSVNRSDGTTISYSYTVVADRDDLEGINLMDEQSVRLYDDEGKEEVEGQIKGFAKTTKRVKICL